MEFLYPFVRQFPFDGVCERIVRELEKRNWEVPGMKVEFDIYGSGDQKMKMVREIVYGECIIRFCRVQRTMPGKRWNDTAAVHTINIPRMELSVHEDESGPTFYMYVGGNWERDAEKFVNLCKVNSKLNGESRMYLQYEGKCHCTKYHPDPLRALRHVHPGRRPPLLMHTNDLERQYDPMPGEFTELPTDVVMETFRSYLEGIVLKAILQEPEAEVLIDILAEPEMIPVPDGLGGIYCVCEGCEAQRIIRGKEDPQQLEPASRYALRGGRRLLDLRIKKEPDMLREVHEGFIWCGVGDKSDVKRTDELTIPEHHFWSERRYHLLKVTPKRANDCFVVDQRVWQMRRDELADQLGERTHFTDSEMAQMDLARARTMVPLHEYKGDYEEPVVLIGREIALDEVEIVTALASD